MGCNWYTLLSCYLGQICATIDFGRAIINRSAINLPLDAGCECLVLLRNVEELLTYLGITCGGGLLGSEFCLSPILVSAPQRTCRFRVFGQRLTAVKLQPSGRRGINFLSGARVVTGTTLPRPGRAPQLLSRRR